MVFGRTSKKTMKYLYKTIVNYQKNYGSLKKAELKTPPEFL